MCNTQDYKELQEYNKYLLSYRKKSVTCQECYTDGFNDAGFNYERTLKEIKGLVEKFDCSSSCDFNTYECDNCKMFQCQGACNYGIKRHILDLIEKKQERMQRVKERE